MLIMYCLSDNNITSPKIENDGYFFKIVKETFRRTIHHITSITSHYILPPHEQKNKESPNTTTSATTPNTMVPSSCRLHRYSGGDFFQATNTSYGKMWGVILVLWTLKNVGTVAAFVPSWSIRRTPHHPGGGVSLGISTDDTNNNNGGGDDRGGIRLNKVFKQTHSRRQADQLIASGRVTVNGSPVAEKGGFKVQPFRDTIALDGEIVHGWEHMNALGNPAPQEHQFEYVKYWKPRGVTCTTDRNIQGNIIEEIGHDGYHPTQRVYPVGRLDKDTSGLILLTSDGRLPNSALRGKYKQPKVYRVMVDKPLQEHHLDQLRQGVVITTVAQRSGVANAKALTAKTKPCKIERLQTASTTKMNNHVVQMTLVEGRNRQIRKMMAALDYRVVKLHRIQFMGITLNPLERPGDWTHVNKHELQMLQNVMERAAAEEDNDNDYDNDDDDDS